jgi:Carboxypeptidase regulatory-like domain
MTRAAVALLVALFALVQADLLIAQREGGTPQPEGGAGPRQGGGGARGAGGGGGGFRGAGGGFQGQGRGLGPLGRGRGQQVQGTAVIRGIVTAADTSTPVRRAQVRATSPDTRSARLSTTDADGRFELKDLPAGRWTLSAAKGGFVTQQFGQRRPFESVDPIDLADGQRFTANFTISRGSVISGRLSDEFGDAITGARVEVLRSQMSQGRRRLTPVGNVNGQTDDTGAFRVFGLAPGDYYVAASLQAAPLDAADNPVTYAPTYYPGTGRVADAQRIPLTLGTEQSGVNFVLLPVRAVRVSGTVADSNGAPVQAVMNLTTAAQGEEGGLQLRNPAPVSPDGTFTILNVVPGDYILNVMGRGNGNAPPEVASVPITVGNEDLAGVTVNTTKGGTIRGTIVTENNAKVTMTNIQLSVQSTRPMPGAFNARGQVSSTGTFELTGLVGPQVLRVDRLPEGWFLKSIRANGTDVTDTTLEFRGSEVVSAQVVLTNRVSEISGAVRVNGQPAVDASVVLFPEDPTQWVFPSRRVRMARVDQNGVFRLRALPTGQRYLALAVDYLEQGEYQDPEFLQRMKARATSFTLSDGESKNLDLTLITR